MVRSFLNNIDLISPNVNLIFSQESEMSKSVMTIDPNVLGFKQNFLLDKTLNLVYPDMDHISLVRRRCYIDHMIRYTLILIYLISQFMITYMKDSQIYLQQSQRTRFVLHVCKSPRRAQIRILSSSLTQRSLNIMKQT